jgi:uncharacterized protein YndB with AHSA1/START domain
MTRADDGDDRGFGTLERGDSAVTLRFTRLLPHPPAKVWRALTEPQHLEAWFPTTIAGELVPGAPLRFGFREAQLPEFEGTMLAFDPPALLELIWGDERLRFELAPAADGTLLTFTASFTELGRAARDAAGWHVCLDLLGCDLNSERAPWAQPERWRAVHGEYVAGFGPEAAAVGPPAELQETYGPAQP